MITEARDTPTLGVGVANIPELTLQTLDDVVENCRKVSRTEYASALALAAERMVPTENRSPIRSPDQLGKSMIKRQAAREQAHALLGGLSAEDRFAVLNSSQGRKITTLPLGLLTEADQTLFQEQNEAIREIVGLRDGEWYDLQRTDPETSKVRLHTEKIAVGKQVMCIGTDAENIAMLTNKETGDNIVLQRQLTVVRGNEVVNPHIFKRPRNFNRSSYATLMPGVGNRTLEVFVASSLWAHVQRGQN